MDKKEVKKEIWKYTLEVNDYVTISVPHGAEVLHFDNQNGKPTVWCLIEPNVTIREALNFRLAGTGHKITDDIIQHIGTSFFGDLVFHLFLIE